MSKWLTYIKQTLEISDSFLKEMDTQLRAQFENEIGKKIDWDKVYLKIRHPLIDPFETYNKGCEKITVLTSAFFSYLPMGGFQVLIFVKYKDGKSYVNFNENIEKNDVTFTILPEKHDYTQWIYEQIPGIDS
jgi:hypothetical protein